MTAVTSSLVAEDSSVAALAYVSIVLGLEEDDVGDSGADAALDEVVVLGGYLPLHLTSPYPYPYPHRCEAQFSGRNCRTFVGCLKETLDHQLPVKLPNLEVYPLRYLESCLVHLVLAQMDGLCLNARVDD